MTPFTIYIGCGDCGGDVDKLAASPWSYEGLNREQTTVFKCKRCPGRWVVRGEMLRAPADAAAAERSRLSKVRARADA